MKNFTKMSIFHTFLKLQKQGKTGNEGHKIFQSNFR